MVGMLESFSSSQLGDRHAHGSRSDFSTEKPKASRRKEERKEIQMKTS